MEMPTLHRPTPRRAFEITPTSTDSSMPPSPAAEPQNPELFMNNRSDRSPPPSRTRSVLNLTSSTLLGIYSGTTDGGGGEELNTPWGTGAQTPAERPSTDTDRIKIRDALQVPSFPFKADTGRPTMHKARRRGFRQYYVPLIMQTVMLFGFGMGFGSLITHLHKTQQITTIPVPTSGAHSQYYQIAWGIMGVILGNALPQIDTLFNDEEAIGEGLDGKAAQHQHIRSLSSTSQSGKERASLTHSGLGARWHPAVRSFGAFVGIAFALVSFFERYRRHGLTKNPEKSTLAIDLAGITNTCSRKSCSVVPH